jgi:hypothetical protein
VKFQKTLFWVLFLLPVVLYTWLLLGPFGGEIDGPRRRSAVFVIMVALGAWLLIRFQKYDWFRAVLITVIGYSAFYKTATFITDVSTFPISLGWSEGSRYYYASLFFSERIYQVEVPPSVLHPSRYLMQAIPFLISGSPLWFHRLWQVFLWISFSLGTGFVLARRLQKGWVLALWAYLFLFQGPVYYHLLVMVILVFGGVKPGQFWRSLFVVLAASAWAGISRVNWFPVPAMLAAALYVIEIPLEKKPVWRYLAPPAVWGIAGTAVAFLSQQLYIIYSGNPVEQFNSSFTSDLLWYRLYPSPTYPGGILRNLLWVMLPLLILLLVRMWQTRRCVHWLRLACLWAALLLLFVVGIVVSVKIGGGSNLHNMDAFLVLLLLVGGYFYLERVANEPGMGINPIPPLKLLVIFAAVVPAFFAITSGGSPPIRDFAATERDLASLRERLAPVVQKGGEVLFIDQRHLLTFEIVEDVPLVPNYEVLFLMEMVMSGNRAYLDQFHQELKEQKFAVIASGEQLINYQGREYEFGEENDTWVKEVSEPLLCYYEATVDLMGTNLVLYVPREAPCK